MRHRPGVFLVLAVAVATAVFAWAARGPAPRPSIAVRFEYNGSASADDARIADGIAIEITGRLAQIDGLDVRAAVRASRYTDPPEDTHVLGLERDAGFALQGLVLVNAGAVRQIHASLVSTARRTPLWSRHFATKNNDIFTVNGAIVAAVAQALDLRWLSGQRQYSIDPVLQTAFLRARALQADGGNVSRPEAIDLFERITKQASTFAPAFAAMATALGGHLSIAGPPPLDRRLADVARTAYEVDPGLAEANVAMGLLSASTCQWTRADAHF